MPHASITRMKLAPFITAVAVVATQGLGRAADDGSSAVKALIGDYLEIDPNEASLDITF